MITSRARSSRVPLVVLVLLVFAGALALAADTPPAGRLLRFPSIHGDTVVFVHGGDIWRASTAGGPARRLTAHPGQELFPRISPDGKWLAYTAEYTGTRQVYVMPVEGGAPKQLTFYNDAGAMPPRGGFDNWILGWTPDGKILVRMARTPWGERMGRYYAVDPKGGLETPFPIPHGGSASPSPDGTKIAYCPIDREFRTWKRTRGGRAQDIWIYDLKANTSERITDDPGTDNFPMWAGDKIYFTSDREHTLNIFVYDVKTRATRKVTNFTEYDVLWPSLGPGAIVFMNGGYLYTLDLATEKTQRLAISIDSEEPLVVPQFKDVKENIAAASISPSGARAILEARGELFSVPAKHGATRNMTQTQGLREMSPAWSPDGKTVAYLSDATGEYELYVRAQDGSGVARQLTKDGAPWKFPPAWSPDGKKIAYADRARRLRVIDVASGAITDVAKGKGGDLDDFHWSPDSQWIAFSDDRPSRLSGIALWSMAQSKVFEVGDGLTQDYDPVFSSDGKYLFFLSNRDYNLTFSAFEFDYVYTRATRVYVVALDPSAPALFPLRSDEEKGLSDAKAEQGGAKDAEAKDAAPKDAKAKGAAARPEKKVEPVKLVPDGFVARTIALPGTAAGSYSQLAAAPDALFYLRGSERTGASLYRYDLKERKEEKVLDGVISYDLTPDGKKLLYHAAEGWGIADARPGLKADDGRLDLAGLRVKWDARAEYRQIFDDGWRIFRDWFYDPAMHGVDWNAMRTRYGQLVPFVAHRAELDWILGEMVGELDSGHTYIGEGDEPRVARVDGGMLGCSFAADPAGRYRIAKIYAGENWDERFRSPLTEPGVDVKEGEYLLAIDGTELTTADNPYRLLEGKGNQQVVLTVAPKPDAAAARKVTVRTTTSELDLMYIDWVKSRIALVDRLSQGKIGYIHLPNTAVEGNRMLQKLFYGQASKQALIVDDRYNGGGFIPDRMIGYFARRTLAWWARRDIAPMRTPAFANDGPKAMLINGFSSSGGDALPYFFHQQKLGTLIGTRTWGGLIGLSGNPAFVDGGSPEVPVFRIYDANGKWVVENEGVSPDIEIFDVAERFNETRDASIEKAVEVLMQQLAQKATTDPATPRPPNLAR